MYRKYWYTYIGIQNKYLTDDLKRHCIGMKGLTGVQLQKSSDNISCRRNFSINPKEDVTGHLKIKGASGKFNNQQRPLLRPSSVNFCPTFLKSISWDSPFKTILDKVVVDKRPA